MIRGGSWAGLEAGRPSQVVSRYIADARSDPTKTVLVDDGAVWAIEMAAASAVEFYLRGAVHGMVMIKIRKWVPELDKFMTGHFQIRPGHRIDGVKLDKHRTGNKRYY